MMPQKLRMQNEHGASIRCHSTLEFLLCKRGRPINASSNNGVSFKRRQRDINIYVCHFVFNQTGHRYGKLSALTTYKSRPHDVFCRSILTVISNGVASSDMSCCWHVSLAGWLASPLKETWLMGEVSGGVAVKKQTMVHFGSIAMYTRHLETGVGGGGGYLEVKYHPIKAIERFHNNGWHVFEHKFSSASSIQCHWVHIASTLQ